MALAVPQAILTVVPPPLVMDGPKFKIPSNHVADLRDIAKGVEETNAGVCTKYLVDQLLGGCEDDIDIDGYVNHLDAVERFCDEYGVWKHPRIITWRRRLLRARRAIAKMHEACDHKHVNVLHVVYGYPDPFITTFSKKLEDALGEVAGLARYTDYVETRRLEIARIEALEMASRKPVIVETKAVPSIFNGNDGLNDRIPFLKRDACDMEEAAEMELERRAALQNVPAQYGPMLIDLIRHREFYQRALRMVSSGDALRSLLPNIPEHAPYESERQYQERRHISEEKHKIVFAHLKVEADQMLSDATRVYHRAWLASSHHG